MKDEKKVKIDSVSVDDAQTTTETSPEPVDDKPSAEELTAQIDELNDKYLRAVAELENTRRRAALDAESRARNRAIAIAEKFLPVMDALQEALKHSPNDSGINSMARAMESAFAQIGIVKIEAVGQILNPQFHNAIQVVDAPQGTKSNTITEELQSGYMFGDSVLRSAMVIVSK